MQSKLVQASILLFTLLLSQPEEALAQSWKRLCVNGGASGGNNNGTWQKINTPSSGGGTWKKAGGCISPPPPTTTPPPPTTTPPFQGVSVESAYSTFNGNRAITTTYTLNGDGTWIAESPGPITVSRGASSGRWYAPGRTINEFEIRWKGYMFVIDSPDYFQISSPEMEWTAMNSSWRISVTDYYAGCEGAGFAALLVEIRLKADHSQMISGTIEMNAHGQSQHCYG